MNRCCRPIFIMLALLPAAAVAGKADILHAEAKRSGLRTFDFTVTVRHADQGWRHYADRWEILGPEDRVLATRVLYHPHVDEQPFTRSLAGVKLPANLTWVKLRAHDLRHGHGGRTVTLSIPQE